MDDASRAEFTAILEGRRVATAVALGARDSGVRDLLAARGVESVDDEHDPEGSTLSAEWSMLEGVRGAEQRELGEIDAALARLVDGTFGICAACGRGIPLDRLHARPTATMCVPCAATLG